MTARTIERKVQIVLGMGLIFLCLIGTVSYLESLESAQHGFVARDELFRPTCRQAAQSLVDPRKAAELNSGRSTIRVYVSDG